MRRILTIALLACSVWSMALVPPRDPERWDNWEAQRTYMQQRERATDGRAKAPAAKKAVGTRTIIPRVLVIMVSFANFEMTMSKADVDSMFNARNWTKDGATGSIRQYFHDQSSGVYAPQFDIVGPVTLEHTYGYYSLIGKGSVGYMATEACALVDDEVDFTLYDSDQDGYVDLVYVFYAGYGQNDYQFIAEKDLVADPDSLIWPAYWNINSAGYGNNRKVFDDKKIYAIEYSNELDGYFSTMEQTIVAGIGTPCHEFCHALGLPDLYATREAHNKKLLGMWDVMCYGLYNNDTHTPPSMSAYERFFMGWLTPTLITEPATLSLEYIGTSNTAYMITDNDKHNLNGVSPDTTVFYLLENRQKTGWDIGVPGSGMKLTRIHYQPDRWKNNTVNNNYSDLGVDIIEADGSATVMDGKPGDVFPKGATEYLGIEDHAITNIAMEDGVISFVYRGGKQDDPTDVTDERLTGTEQPQKLIRDGRLLIYRNGLIYSADGQLLR